MKMHIMIILLSVCFALSSFCAGVPAGAFRNERLKAATEKFADTYEKDFQNLSATMLKLKLEYSKKGDSEFVKIIDKILNGKPVTDSLPGNIKSPLNTFRVKMEKLTISFIKYAEKQMQVSLKEGKNGQATQIAELVSQLTALTRKTSLRDRKKGVRIHAEKDWQDTGFEVTEGDIVDVYCKGSWSRGTVKLGRRHWEKVEGDADKNNVQLKIGDNGKLFRGGKKWNFTATDSGEVKIRMFPYQVKLKKAGAEGSVFVEMEKSTNNLSNLQLYLTSMFAACRDRIAAKNRSQNLQQWNDQTLPGSVPVAPPDQGITRNTVFQLPAAKHWQETPIRVKQGDTVKITAEGNWDSGYRIVKNNGKWRRLSGNANKLQYQVKIGDKVIGKGGKNKKFTAEIPGLLSFRIAPIWKNRQHEKISEPSGFLNLEVILAP